MNHRSQSFLSQWLKCLASVVFLFSGLTGGAQVSLSDCSGAIEICGNGAISSNASGFGQQEISSNACASEEHHSLWIRIEITKSGTLGFTLTPTSTDITVDYDFWIFGPNATCGGLGTAIRCSTTNPQAAGLFNNHTGMNDGEIDISEGPGPDGNSFVKSLDVQPGETYYIVVDRPIGESPFDLEWTGTSTIGEFPFPEGVVANEPADLVQCGVNGTAEFDLNQTRQEINSQPQTLITYHASLANAVDQLLPLGSPYVSTFPQKTIFARVENLATGCSQIVDFDLLIPEGPAVQPVDLQLCNLDDDGFVDFDLHTLKRQIITSNDPDNHTITYFRNEIDAAEAANEISSGIRTNGGKFFARVEESSGAGCPSITEINLSLIPPTTLTGIASEGIGLKVGSNSISVGLNENFDYSLDDPNGPYLEMPFLEDVSAGLHTLYIRRKDACEVIAKEVVVPEFPAVLSPNGDGYFDRWSVNTGNFPVGHRPVIIFDRYGKTLAEIAVNQDSWDGTYNGKELPVDDYWFMFSLPDGNVIKGHFSLIK